MVVHFQVFELCESLNAVTVMLDMHKMLDDRKALPWERLAVLEALGEVAKAAGARFV
ncbi:unnamed protein product, partial [Choristocarpus tenellus]